MLNYIILIMLVAFSLKAVSSDILYDEVKKRLYISYAGENFSVPFAEDLSSNPSSAFGVFNGYPSIIISSRSIHDYTAYVTLVDNNGLPEIDCIYFDMKSKLNGVSSKEGMCELNRSFTEGYLDAVQSKADAIFNNMDRINTRYLLSGEVKYLPVLISRVNGGHVYKVYKDKSDFLEGNYVILKISDKNKCHTFSSNTWVIHSKQNENVVSLNTERNESGKIMLGDEVVSNVIADETCNTFPPYSVKMDKAFFYDKNNIKRKSYLIKGDFVTLRNMSDDEKWCDIEYLNNNSEFMEARMLCSSLTL